MMVVVFQLRQMPAVAAASFVVGAGRNLDEGVGNRLWKTGRRTHHTRNLNSHRGGGPTPTRRGAGGELVVQLVNRDGVDDQPEAAGAQVRSLTQFYSVDFLQSRIDVKKCVFKKRTIKVCVSCC